jgi:hypothetical protein
MFFVYQSSFSLYWYLFELSFERIWDGTKPGSVAGFPD